MARRKNKYKVSKAEKEILSLLQNRGFNVMPQFKIAGVPFIYDFFFPQLKIILEYQGSYWHADPKIYKSGALIKMPGFKDKIIVDYIWYKDSLKSKMAEMHGFKVYYLWESDYKQHGWMAVERSILQRS